MQIAHSHIIHVSTYCWYIYLCACNCGAARQRLNVRSIHIVAIANCSVVARRCIQRHTISTATWMHDRTMSSNNEVWLWRISFLNSFIYGSSNAFDFAYLSISSSHFRIAQGVSKIEERENKIECRMTWSVLERQWKRKPTRKRYHNLSFLFLRRHRHSRCCFNKLCERFSFRQ